MRRSQVWAIASKDIADFKTSRYALYSLLIPPLAFGAIMPLIFLLPFQAVLNPTPHDLDLDQLQPGPANASQVVLNHVHIQSTVVSNCKVNGSLIENTTLQDTFVENSRLSNVRLVNSFVISSNVEGPLDNQNSILDDVVFVGQDPPEGSIVASVLVNLMMLMLMIIPAMVPTVLASYSLVGEKASGSLEPLLATPSTDNELLAGKVTAILLPTLAVAWVGATLSLVVVSLAGGDFVKRNPLPLDIFAAAAALFVPAFAVLSILANVIVSSRVSDVRAAQQIGGIVVLPVILFFVSSLSGAASFGLVGIMAAAAVVAVVDLVLILVCVRVFQREEILVRWK